MFVLQGRALRLSRSEERILYVDVSQSHPPIRHGEKKNSADTVLTLLELTGHDPITAEVRRYWLTAALVRSQDGFAQTATV